MQLREARLEHKLGWLVLCDGFLQRGYIARSRQRRQTLSAISACAARSMWSFSSHRMLPGCAQREAKSKCAPELLSQEVAADGAATDGCKRSQSGRERGAGTAPFRSATPSKTGTALVPLADDSSTMAVPRPNVKLRRVLHAVLGPGGHKRGHDGAASEVEGRHLVLLEKQLGKTPPLLVRVPLRSRLRHGAQAGIANRRLNDQQRVVVGGFAQRRVVRVGEQLVERVPVLNCRCDW